MYFDPGHGKFVAVDGQIVERDALHVAERIKEYDENLEILCLDPDKAGVNDAPFVICCKRSDGTMYRVFEAWELDERVVQRIFQADGNRFNAISALDSMESAQKKLAADRYRDKQDEMKDIMAHAVANRTSSYVIENHEGEKVKIHEDRPPEYNNGRSYHHSKSATPVR